MSPRGTLAKVTVGATLASAVFGSPPPPLDANTDSEARATRRFSGGITVHAVRTGWVRVKEAHRTLAGPAALRLPAIVLGRAWTEWMPVIVYVVVHPEGVYLVDAGLSEDTLDPLHFGTDRGNAFVYGTFLRFLFSPEDRIDRQLVRLGIPLDAVRGVVLTHRHADHSDGLPYLPDTAVAYVGAPDWPTHAGALDWSARRAPALVEMSGGEPFGALSNTTPLTRDGAVRAVALPGHSPGHLGALLHTPEGDVLFGGDAAFGLHQVDARQLAGIVERPRDARRSLDQIAAQLAASPRTTAVFAHEPASLTRLGAGGI